MARTPNTLTDEERDERRQAQRRQLENALAALLTSEGWRRWLQTRATLHAYSANNTLLIAQQAHERGIDPTHVAGFKAWLRLGRCVRKGERGLRIWAPMRLKAREQDGEETGERRVGFRTTSVFDVSQTDVLPGVEPAPLTPPCEPIEGDSHAHLLTGLENLAAELGYSVRELPLVGSADGWCDPKRHEIVVNEQLAPNGCVRMLVHELAHALGVGYEEFGRARAETIVDAVIFCRGCPGTALGF